MGRRGLIFPLWAWLTLVEVEPIMCVTHCVPGSLHTSAGPGMALMTPGCAVTSGGQNGAWPLDGSALPMLFCPLENADLPVPPCRDPQPPAQMLPVDTMLHSTVCHD